MLDRFSESKREKLNTTVAEPPSGMIFTTTIDGFKQFTTQTLRSHSHAISSFVCVCFIIFVQSAQVREKCPTPAGVRCTINASIQLFSKRTLMANLPCWTLNHEHHQVKVKHAPFSFVWPRGYYVLALGISSSQNHLKTKLIFFIQIQLMRT